MARRIVSLRGNEPRISPASSSSSVLSVLSIDSILSDPHKANPETQEAQPADLGVDPMSATSLSKGVKPKTDNQFLRHDTYFFKDGNITFLVDGTLYCIHRFFFARDSDYFSSKFAQLDIDDHEPLHTIISLSDVERKDFEAFLSAIYPENFDEHNFSYEQWKSVLHLSTRWGFASLRKLALKSIVPPTACDKLLLARTYGVDDWVLPALSALCERKAPISLKEARRMDIDDVILITTVREEDSRRSPLFPGMTAISRRIEATQARMLVRAASDDDESPDSSEDEKEPQKEVVTGVEVDSHKAPTPFGAATSAFGAWSFGPSQGGNTTPKELAATTTSKPLDKHGSDMAESSAGSQDKIVLTSGQLLTPKVITAGDILDRAFPVKTKKKKQPSKTSSSSSPFGT